LIFRKKKSLFGELMIAAAEKSKEKGGTPGVGLESLFHPICRSFEKKRKHL
jgi:hypothetical protein